MNDEERAARNRRLIEQLGEIYDELKSDEETPEAKYVRRLLLRGAYACGFIEAHPETSYEVLEHACTSDMNPGM